MIKMYKTGTPFELIIEPGKNQFSRPTLLKQLDENRQILRVESNDELEQTYYSLVENGRLLAYIKGFGDKNWFHIQRIENATHDGKSGLSLLSKIHPEMERDLKKRGVEKITTNALVRLAPILVKRYGFKAKNGQTYEQLKKSWFRFISIKTVQLEKNI